VTPRGGTLQHSVPSQSLGPLLTAALAGRFAPVAAEWLGIHPDDVTVKLHTGPGWGTLRLAEGTRASTGALDSARTLWAALPASWLPSVWACGLALVDGHLIIGVTTPGWPAARVLAVPSPGAQPVEIEVHGTLSPPRPVWSKRVPH
jgi:hypothetical protein